MKNILDKELSYKPQLLYEALLKSTDEYIYICNMKTGLFRYPAAMAKESISG